MREARNNGEPGRVDRENEDGRNLTGMVITDLLSRNAELYGDDAALVEVNPEIAERRRVTWKEYGLVEAGPANPYRREITWGEFEEKANRCAQLLISRGIRKGDKVGILLMNCLEWLPLYFGILKAGAVAVPLNYRYDFAEIEYCVRLADAKALFFGPEFIGRIEKICDELDQVEDLFFVGDNCPTFAENYFRLASDCASRAPKIELTEDDFAAIYFSSGTTGFPKAILHRHRSLIHSCRVEQMHHGQTRSDVFLCIPPLYHTGAKMHWFGSLISGGRAVLLRGTRPESVFRAISAEKCTIVWLLVPWAQDMLDAIDEGRIDLDSLELGQWRLMHIGAQPVPPSLIRRWKTVFPHHDYDTNYGLSESIGPGCVHLGIGNERKVGAIGRAGFGWKTKIVDESGAETPRGEVGELCVSGPGVMDCYYKDEAATREALKGGWLLTGDMATEDPDGFIFLVDRKKDVIITGGENLYPVQIEDFLRAHDDIKDVAVIGLPDRRLGEIACAVVEVKPGRTLAEEDVNEFCRALPRYKRPRRVVFAEVPRNLTGKIEKTKLRERYCGESPVIAQIKH